MRQYCEGEWSKEPVYSPLTHRYNVFVLFVLYVLATAVAAAGGRCPGVFEINRHCVTAEIKKKSHFHQPCGTPVNSTQGWRKWEGGIIQHDRNSLETEQQITSDKN